VHQIASANRRSFPRGVLRGQPLHQNRHAKHAGEARGQAPRATLNPAALGAPMAHALGDDLGVASAASSRRRARGRRDRPLSASKKSCEKRLHVRRNASANRRPFPEGALRGRPLRRNRQVKHEGEARGSAPRAMFAVEDMHLERLRLLPFASSKNTLLGDAKRGTAMAPLA